MSLSARDFTTMLEAMEISKYDLAEMADYTVRAVEKWQDADLQVPRLVALLLFALKQKKITRGWIRTTIEDYAL